MMTILLTLLTNFTHATNYESEGWFKNNSTSSMSCYKDVDGCVAVEHIEPGESCQGDGIMLPDGSMFKIPNHSNFDCDETCYASGLKSSAVFRYAKHKNGNEKYGAMTLFAFRQLVRGEYCRSADEVVCTPDLIEDGFGEYCVER